MKKILLCGNGKSGEIIPAIKTWGFQVALISEFDDDNGVSDVDIYVKALSKNPIEAVKAASYIWDKGFHFDAVLSLCWDCAVSVSHISQKYQLIGLPVNVANDCTFKDRRSYVFQKRKVPSPKYDTAYSFDELLNKIPNFNFPLILKPIDLSSSKGVVLVQSTDELESAYKHIKNHTNLPFVVNEFISGSEHSLEGLMIEGKLHLTGFSDRVFASEYLPFFVEIGDILPSSLDEEEQDSIRVVTEKAALSLGIYNGVVKGDLLKDSNGNIYVLEIAARLGGPRFGTEIVPLSNGTNILKALIIQNLGKKVPLKLLRPQFSKGVVAFSVFPQPGRIVSIEGIEKIKNMPGYYDFKWWEKELFPGDVIQPYMHGCGNVAYFIVTGETREVAIYNAKAIQKIIDIKTEVIDEKI